MSRRFARGALTPPPPREQLTDVAVERRHFLARRTSPLICVLFRLQRRRLSEVLAIWVDFDSRFNDFDSDSDSFSPFLGGATVLDSDSPGEERR